MTRRRSRAANGRGRRASGGAVKRAPVLIGPGIPANPPAWLADFERQERRRRGASRKPAVAPVEATGARVLPTDPDALERFVAALVKAAKARRRGFGRVRLAGSPERPTPAPRSSHRKGRRRRAGRGRT